jgi:quercetin dioxygenase-like cupin family protein
MVNFTKTSSALPILFLLTSYLLFNSVASAEDSIVRPTAKGEIIHSHSVEKRQVGQGKAIIELMKTGKNAFIGRLILAAHAQVPKHRDPTEEYLLIEQGQGQITIDGKQSLVSKGDLIYMPANAEVSFINGQQTLVALQVFAGPQSASKYGKWQVISSEDGSNSKSTPKH